MYVGVFLVTLVTLMYQILLTRIFSVTMWYHFAFLAVSVSMFGMTIGALIVYLRPGYFTDKRAEMHLSLSSLLFAVSIPLSFLLHISFPFRPAATVEGVFSSVVNYLVLAVPFTFSGICVCIALTRFPTRVGSIYAVDLCGAAIGCVAILFLLQVLDAPTAVLAVAVLAALGGMCFVHRKEYPKLWYVSLFTGVTLALVITPYLFEEGREPLVRLTYVKNRIEPPALYEKWNSFSRIRIQGNPNLLRPPFGWGISPAFPGRGIPQARELVLDIDASARTWLTGWDGDSAKLEYLKYDIVNLVHFIRSDAKVFVVGAGGGRDVLSALVFGQKSVTAAEINGDIIKAVNERFGDFTGHLDRDPRVTFVVEDARSFIARQPGYYDIIQISLVDTWAATAAGAFVLAENSLYTLDAWKVFFDRLEPDGVLSVSRNYIGERPAEIYRTVSLAHEALLVAGAENPEDHIVLFRHKYSSGNGIGTMLISKKPFSEANLATFHSLSSRLRFELMLAPGVAKNSEFASLVSATQYRDFVAGFPLDISPPTDDRPFFFQMLRFNDLFNDEVRQLGGASFNIRAIVVLGTLLAVVFGLTLLCIIVPLYLTRRTVDLQGAMPFFMFFACIGFGFMFIEISLLQRMIVFLGHPTYSLSVVLFGLLLASGVGSMTTQSNADRPGGRHSWLRFALLLVTLTVCGIYAPDIVLAFQGSTTPARIATALALILPIGFFLGMPFPLGLAVASDRANALTPWFWGINGATSVCGSVVSLAVALMAGISATFWTGCAFYFLACVAFLWMRRETQTA